MLNIFFNYCIIIKNNLHILTIFVLVYKIFLFIVNILSWVYGIDTSIISLALIELIENINTLKTPIDGSSFLESNGLSKETGGDNDKTPSTPVKGDSDSDKGDSDSDKGDSDKDDLSDLSPDLRESPSVRRMSTSLGDNFLLNVSRDCHTSYPDMSDEEYQEGLYILEHAPEFADMGETKQGDSGESNQK